MTLTKTPVCNFGKKAEDFKLESINNKLVSLQDIRGQKATLIMFIGAGLRADMNILYYLGIGIATMQFGWQVLRLDIEDPRDCLAKFKSNKWLGLLITFSLVAGQTW